MTTELKPVYLTLEDFSNPSETLVSHILNEANKKKLRNCIATCIQDLICLEFKSGHEAEYANSVSQLRGEITAYRLLLDDSDRAKLIEEEE